MVDRWVPTVVNMGRDSLPNGQPVITQQQLKALLPDPSKPQTGLKNFPKSSPSTTAQASWTGARGYIMQAVKNELENTYGFTAKQIDGAGLQIVTTVNQRKMSALYAAVNEARKMMRLDRRPLPWYAHIGSILENPNNRAIQAWHGGPGF